MQNVRKDNQLDKLLLARKYFGSKRLILLTLTVLTLSHFWHMKPLFEKL